MRKFYIAGRYVNKVKIAAFAEKVRALGFGVTSSWLEEDHSPNVEMIEFDARTLRAMSIKDRDEIAACDEMIFFSELDTLPTARNGRHVEFGMAIAMGKPIHVIGPYENIFHHLPLVWHYPSEQVFFQGTVGI